MSAPRYKAGARLANGRWPVCRVTWDEAARAQRFTVIDTFASRGAADDCARALAALRDRGTEADALAEAAQP